MEKIKTIFDRDWEGNRGVVDKIIVDFDFSKSTATEKLDGTNVRITVRNKTVVRVEKRRNPTKIQKHNGITEPWYVDADESSPQDKYIFEAVKNRIYEAIPDGEWSGEVIGPKVQGNPLKLEEHMICLFSYNEAPIIANTPTTFKELKEWLPKQKSQYYNSEEIIEGIVWHGENGEMVKIKNKDFKDNYIN